MNSPPVVPIRSIDGEQGYRTSKYELQQSNNYQKLYDASNGFCAPPNLAVSIQPDGTQIYPTQTIEVQANRTPRPAHSSNRQARSSRYASHSYTQYNYENGRGASNATHNTRSNPNSHTHREDRVDSKPDPPSYDTVVSESTDNTREPAARAEAATNDTVDTSSNKCPTCNQRMG